MAKKNAKTEGLSTTDFAKKIGVSRQRVIKAIEDGVLSKSVIKIKHATRVIYRIKEKEGLKEWADNIDPAKQRDTDKAAQTRELSQGGGDMSGFQKAKAAKEFYAAKLAQLEYEEKTGTVIPADKVRIETFKIGRLVRDALLSVPDKVAPEIAIMDNPREISIFIKEHLALALKDLENLKNVGSKK